MYSVLIREFFKLKEKENVAESVKEEIVKVKRQRKMNRVCTEEKELSTLTMQELIHYRPKRYIDKCMHKCTFVIPIFQKILHKEN